MELFSELSLTVIGILIEAVPFVVLAAIILFLLDVLKAEALLAKCLGGPVLVAVPAAVVFSVILPFSECCIVPLYRRLVDRGVPAPAAIAFLVGAPSLNFVVIANTYVATNGDAGLMARRFGISALLAVVFGLAATVFLKKRAGILPQSPVSSSDEVVGTRLSNAFDRAISDFRLMLGLLVFGAIMTGLFHIGLHDFGMEALEENMALNTPSMMVFAMIISTCATSDASIAMAMRHFPDIAKLSFMVIGPVVDIKLIAMHMKLTDKKTAAFIIFGYPLMAALVLVLFSFTT